MRNLQLDDYRVANQREIVTPALLVFRQLVIANLEDMIRIAGRPERLRPHAKTHKLAQVAQMELELGIQKHKCATFAEAEMLAVAGAKDVFLAYNLVGPNIDRAVQFRQQFPHVRLSVTADHPQAVDALSAAMRSAGQSIEVLLDLDVGQHRTGLPPGDQAVALYKRLVDSAGVRPAGLHVYDGHNHQRDVPSRREAVLACWQQADALRQRLRQRQWPVPAIVAGGTGSFPIFASLEDPALQLSPGTCVFHDAGYSDNFPDLPFRPAALLLTRVISRPTANRITMDLGYKACASDPAVERRLVFPALDDARIVLQNEEHLVVESGHAEKYQPGDTLLAVPWHICPTTALHKQVFVIEDGRYTTRWDVRARDRWLSI